MVRMNERPSDPAVTQSTRTRRTVTQCRCHHQCQRQHCQQRRTSDSHGNGSAVAAQRCVGPSPRPTTPRPETRPLTSLRVTKRAGTAAPDGQGQGTAGDAAEGHRLVGRDVGCCGASRAPVVPFDAHGGVGARVVLCFGCVGNVLIPLFHRYMADVQRGRRSLAFGGRQGHAAVERAAPPPPVLWPACPRPRGASIPAWPFFST